MQHIVIELIDTISSLRTISSLSYPAIIEHAAYIERLDEQTNKQVSKQALEQSGLSPPQVHREEGGFRDEREPWQDTENDQGCRQHRDGAEVDQAAERQQEVRQELGAMLSNSEAGIGFRT